MSKRNAKILVTLLMVIFVASMIFFFSSQDSDDSSKTSGSIVEWLLPRIFPGFEKLAKKQRRPVMRYWKHLIRKVAHFSEYGLLSLTLVFYLRYMLEGKKLRVMAFTAWLLATLYACTDELHQMFVKGRGPSPIDVCIDSAGALTGALVGLAIVIIWFWLKQNRSDCA